MSSTEWPDRPIFIIDDDQAWIDALRPALHRLGWKDVRALADPDYAVQLACEFQPAVILLDLVMTQRNGLQVLRDLQEQKPDLPVIMVSGNDQVDQAVVCMQHGASDYLTKPLRKDKLEAALERAVRREMAPEPEPEPVAVGAGGGGTQVEEAKQQSFQATLPELEELPNIKEVPDMLIEEALRRSDGVVKDAAAMLGVSPQAICNRKRRASRKK